MDFKSKHLGNMPEDVLDSRPEMVVLWAGYAFSRDYSAPRGHMLPSRTYAIRFVQDVPKTERAICSRVLAGHAKAPMYHA